MIFKTDIKKAIQENDLSGKSICLHSSLSSFGTVDGGADEVIQAFLDENCTLVVPTFTTDYHEVKQPEGRKIKQNAGEGANNFKGNVFNVDENVINKDLGIIPTKVLHNKNRIRGLNHLCSLTALGEKAPQIMEHQSLLNVYGPYRYLYENEDAYVLLMGVDLNRATPIHLAEEMSGKELFRSWSIGENNETVEVQVGSCSEGFHSLEKYVSEFEKNALVGKSKWRIFPLKEFLDTLTKVMAQDNMITHCGDDNCSRCNDSALGGPIFDDN
jgi:aminoglycoside N3'-acetyltransferase